LINDWQYRLGMGAEQYKNKSGETERFFVHVFSRIFCYITVQPYKITISNLGFRFNHYTLSVFFCIVYFVMFTSLLIFFFHCFLSTPTVILRHTVKTPQS